MARIGRPPIDREAAFDVIVKLPRVGRHVVKVNARQVAATLGCQRVTVGRILTELEQNGRIRRRWLRGRAGLYVEILQ